MSWFAVHTLAQKEALANFHLKREGFDTFFPHVSEWVGIKTNRARLVKRAWLSRYLFVNTVRELLYKVNETIGVATVVYAAGQQPFPIRMEIMQALFDRADPLGEVYRPGRQDQEFSGEAGDRFRFGETSRLWGLRATIAQVLDDKKIIAILDRAICGTTHVELAPSDVGELIKAETRQSARSRSSNRTPLAG